MSHEFNSVYAPIDAIEKNNIFASATGRASCMTNKRFFSACEAESFLADELKNGDSGYAIYYDIENVEIKNATITKLKARIRSAAEKRRALGAKYADLASKFSTRTCPDCKRVNYMSDHSSVLRFYHSDNLHDITRGCRHCNNKTLPFTPAQSDKLNAASETIREISAKLTEAEQTLIVKMHKQGKIKLRACIGAWYHESYSCEFDDDY